MRPARSAFSAVELLIVVATICLMAAAFLPYMTRQGCHCQRINCVNNLKQVGLAFLTWGLDNNDKLPMQVSITNGGSMEMVASGYVFPHFQVMSNELSTPKLLMCPEEPDVWRVLATTFSGPVPANSGSSIPFTNDNNLSYLVGVDAAEINPSAILTGDHYLNINGRAAGPGIVTTTSKSRVTWGAGRLGHNGQGNIGLVDGSVLQVGSTALQRLFIQAGTNAGRLALP